jgi:hypothetical protein
MKQGCNITFLEGKSESRIKLGRSGLKLLEDVENDLREPKFKRDKLASVIKKSKVLKRP